MNKQIEKIKELESQILKMGSAITELTILNEIASAISSTMELQKLHTLFCKIV